LGDLKGMARGAAMPELRSQGQGMAAQMVSRLDASVRQAVARGGPEATAALETGRANTVAKHQVASVLEDVGENPVQAFKKLTANGDAGVPLLRRVADAAPNAVPVIGRAWLDQKLETATERGRFDHADKLYADWQRMGPQTKRLLFPDEGHRAALDQFFLLAKRLNENPNPSGTATTNNVFNWVSGPGFWGVSKLLQTAPGARFVARVMAIPKLPPAPASVHAGLTTAAQKAAWIQVAAAARASGLSVPALSQAASTEAPDR
jgi:hypothetical protein